MSFMGFAFRKVWGNRNKFVSEQDFCEREFAGRPDGNRRRTLVRRARADRPIRIRQACSAAHKETAGLAAGSPVPLFTRRRQDPRSCILRFLYAPAAVSRAITSE